MCVLCVCTTATAFLFIDTGIIIIIIDFVVTCVVSEHIIYYVKLQYCTHHYIHPINDEYINYCTVATVSRIYILHVKVIVY